MWRRVGSGLRLDRMRCPVAADRFLVRRVRFASRHPGFAVATLERPHARPARARGDGELPDPLRGYAMHRARVSRARPSVRLVCTLSGQNVPTGRSVRDRHWSRFGHPRPVAPNDAPISTARWSNFGHERSSHRELEVEFVQSKVEIRELGSGRGTSNEQLGAH